MANEIPLISGQKNVAADTIEVMYTAPSDKSILILSFTATNNTASSKTYKAYIYNSAGSSNGATIPQQIVVKDRFDLGAAIIGHTIPKGGTLRIESSGASSLVFRATGRAI